MKTSTVLRAGMTALIIMILGVGALHAQTQVKSLVIGGSGGQTASATNQITLTLGQTIVGETASTTNECQTGFWRMLWTNTTTAVTEDMPGFRNQLFQNAPNPFNPKTTIRFSLAEEAETRIEVFDLKGRRVASLLNETVAAGEYSVVFQPDNLPSGVYLLRLKSGAFCDSYRLVLLK